MSVSAMFRYIFSLLLLLISDGLLSPMKIRSMKEIVVFTPNNMRIHDNLCLQHTNGKRIIPVIFAPSHESIEFQEAAISLRKTLKAMGGEALEFTNEDQSFTDFARFVKRLSEECKEDGISITYCKTAVQPVATFIDQMINLSTSSILFEGLWDEIVTFDASETIKSDLKFDEFAEQYKSYSLVVSKPIMQPKILFDTDYKTDYNSELKSAPQTTYKTTSKTNLKTSLISTRSSGEERALSLLTEYLTIGDKEFSYKYASLYASSFADSRSHVESIQRLGPTGVVTPIVPGEKTTKAEITEEKASKDLKATNFFQGEVLSALLAPSIMMGCLSPRLLIHAKSTLMGKNKGASLEFPWVNRITQEAVRKDWHNKLSRVNHEQVILDGSGLEGWDLKYSNWRGYIQREGVYRESKKIKEIKEKPLVFLLHGFGGSLEQMTTFAKELSEDFTVISLDSLGFGYSEKPPLSYNQYLWRDQVVDYVIREAGERGAKEIILMGNSIGGFTVASVAVRINQLSANYNDNKTVKCNGLVLMNSAGRILENTGPGMKETPFFDLFPAYKGPTSQALRVFGKVVFSLLQPRIEQMLVWLYPSNPEAVKTGLAGRILRDSQDPGASDVIASGGKLPSPRPMNDLFREYLGPVLIAQGALDPLNDAKSRAKQFEMIRDGITVDLMPLGHCPMDEGPKMVAASVVSWAKKEKIIITQKEKISDTVS